MRTAVLLLTLAAASADPWSASHCDLEMGSFHDFCTYMHAFNKTYGGNSWKPRLQALLHNKAQIDAHNAAEHSYMLALNSLSDMNREEFLKKLAKPRKRHLGAPRGLDRIMRKKVPRAFDWREHSDMTPVRQQGDCGSCFAIVAGEILDWWHWRLQKGDKNRTSVQELMDCSKAAFPLDIDGCDGGTVEYPLRWASEHRVLHEKEDRYDRKNERCPSRNVPYETLHPKRMHHTGVWEERDLETSLANYLWHFGPVAVSFDASDEHFQNLGKGIYKPKHCSNNRVNHAMLLVGYTPTYYIIKNSWGGDWGSNGYFKLARKNKKMCGIAEVVSIVLDAEIR